MGRPFAVFDIDGTLIRWQLYHSLADHLARHQYIRSADYQKMKDARMAWKIRSKPDAFSKYEHQVISLFDLALKNISPAQLEETADEVFDEYKDQAYTYSRDLISSLKDKGYFLIAISGSPAEIVSKVAKHYGFDDWRATVHYSKDNKFTGAKRVVAYHKDQALSQVVSKHDLSFKNSVGLGDTKSDIPLLEMVERPIAFNPERYLFDYAKQHHWKIVMERKNVAYELEEKNGTFILA